MFVGILLLLQAAPTIDVRPAPEKPQEKLICRTYAELGSRIPNKRICATAAQWKQQSLDAQKAINDLDKSSPALAR